MGEAVNIDAFKNYLSNLNEKITAVFCQYCETSTGVLHPVGQIGYAIKSFDPDIYFVVDGVSCIGAVDANMERDNIDALISGSQKLLCCHQDLLLSHTMIEHSKDFKSKDAQILFRFN